MRSLAEMMTDASSFLCGVELVTTRGTMAEGRGSHTRAFAAELAGRPDIDWVSITDNAGGNPMLSPMALGKPILYAGKEVLIHLSCKDFNRNGLESQAWQLASEGFHNILALSGDYPVAGYRGEAKPVFDIDSVGLLTMLSEMNRGMTVGRPTGTRQLGRTQFHLGAVTTNFKRHENEVVPQYLKLEKKIAAGASFIIAQIGFDSRKSSELLAYMRSKPLGHIPLIGNVFLLNARVAKFFRDGNIPGVIVTDALWQLCERHGASPDRGRAFFLELAAKQVAIFRGLGFRGAYLGGVENCDDIGRILELEKSFGAHDWKSFAREIRFSQPNEFYYFAEDPASGLADADRLDPPYEASLARPKKTRNVTLGYRVAKWAHHAAFTPGTRVFALGKKVYENSANPEQGPALLRAVEHLSKAAMFRCKDCGDCSLPDIGYLCPESQCAKNQRNGPCGGTRDGKCEVAEFECIWSRAYDRAKYEGRTSELLPAIPVIQNQALRGTSAWGNTYRGRDHYAVNANQRVQLTISARSSPSPGVPGEGIRGASREDLSVTISENPMSTATTAPLHTAGTKAARPFQLIGELINHSFARARRAWEARDVGGYQALARLQALRGADFLTVNIDGTQSLSVRLSEMLEFLPKLVPALQEATSLPLAFDNPSIEFHRVALRHYDRSKGPAPVLNSLAASRQHLEQMIQLVIEHDTWVVVMASEKFTADGGSPCTSAEDVYRTAKRFVEMLVEKAGRRTDQVIIDPGLAPIGADTYGLVNMGLDAMRMIRADRDLAGVHISVGLTNFSFGTPKEIREDLENAYITLAAEAGLDFVLGNPEKNLRILPPDHRALAVVKEALAAGRPVNGESQEDAGFRQAEKVMDLF